MSYMRRQGISLAERTTITARGVNDVGDYESKITVKAKQKPQKA